MGASARRQTATLRRHASCGAPDRRGRWLLEHAAFLPGWLRARLAASPSGYVLVHTGLYMPHTEPHEHSQLAVTSSHQTI